jgi:predicted permease
MENLIAILQTALPVFLALGLGMLCRKTGFLNREAIDALKKVVINLTLPAVLVGAFATARYSASTIVLPVMVYALCCLALGLGFCLTRLFRVEGRLAPFIASGFEAGMLGYALFALLFPRISVSQFAILDLGQTLFVFTLYKILLSGETDLKDIGKDMVKTPILWAVLAGVLIGATGLFGLMKKAGVSGVLTSVTNFISAPTGMIILLTVGYDLVPREIPWKKTIKLIAVRLIVMAVILTSAVMINQTLLNDAMMEWAMVLMVILPPPYVIPVFADEPDERVQISSALSALTLVTMILFAVCSVLVGIR